MKTLVKKAALDLIQRNQTTTTLEVKQELIAKEPFYFWKQNFISATLAELADSGELDYTDNGVFRIYRLPNTATSLVNILQTLATSNAAPSKYAKIPLSQRNVVKVNLTDLAKLVESNAGKFIGIVHIKKTTGHRNTMNCQVLKGLTPLGAIQVKEQGQLKTIYPTDLLEVRAGSTVYQLK
jgi:hypothetical protein